jgi:hypothetical protein
MEGTPMAEVSESPFLRGDVPRINPEPEQNSRENQDTLEQIEANPARGRADDRVEFSEEARRQDALGRGVEDLAPNETETEATLTPNAPIPEEQDIREVGDPNSLGNAPGANQAANFSIEQRIPQDAEVSGDLSGRQELGSGVELREDSEVNPLGNQNNPIENRDNTGPVGERIESQNQRTERQESSEPSDQDIRIEQQRSEQQQEFNEQGSQAEQDQGTVENRIRENTQNQDTEPEPREGISQTAAGETERSQILDNPRQDADLDTSQQPAGQETAQTNQTGQTEEVRPAQQEEIDSQNNEQQQDRQEVSRQEDRNQDPVAAQTQVGRNVDELI